MATHQIANAPTHACPTWEDIERAALHCSVLQRAVTHVRLGDCSREEALISAALFLSQRNTAALHREAEQRAWAPLAALDEAMLLELRRRELVKAAGLSIDPVRLIVDE